jgi:uncharacterized lipoprotein YmbA
MKHMILILSTVLSGCAMSSEKMSTYKPIDVKSEIRNAALGVSGSVNVNTRTLTVNQPAPSPQAQTIVTTQGNYVIIPNYSTGQIQSVIGPRR